MEYIERAIALAKLNGWEPTDRVIWALIILIKQQDAESLENHNV